MKTIIECVGCPRDQGLDQGEALRGAIRDRAARAGLATTRRSFGSLRAFLRGPTLGGGPAREIVRHYTHLAERTEGIALGAGLPLSALFDLALGHSEGLSAEATAAACHIGGTRLVRMLPAASSPRSPWVLRRSRPEVGFESVEVTLPWLAPAVAGVNEAGVAAALAVVADGDAAVPAMLVQEALQRFSDLEGALDWCCKRPVEGRAGLVLADSTGEIAGLEIDGRERRVLRASDGILALGGSADCLSKLRKGLEDGAPLDAERLGGDGAGMVALHPERRELSVGGERLRI